MKKNRDSEIKRESVSLEESFKTFTTASADSFFITDTEGRFREINPAYCDLTGYSKEELLTMSIPDIEVRKAPENVKKHIEKSIIAGHARFETAYRRKDGKIAEVEASITLIKLNNKQLLFTFVRDITECNRKEKEMKFRSKLLDNTLDSIIVHDLEGNIIYANETTYKSRGYSKEEFLNMKLHDLATPENAEIINVRIKELIEKGKISFESANFRKDKSIMPVEVSSHVIEMDGKKVIVSAERDITEHKRIESEIRRNYDIQSAINSILRISLENISLEELLKRIFNQIISFPWLVLESKGGIFLVESKPDVLVLKVQSNLAEPIQKACSEVPFGKCMCGRAALNQKIEFAECIDHRHEISYKGIIPHGHYCVPIIYAGKTMGAIVLYLKEGHRRNQQEEDFLTACANTLAGIIQRKRAEDELKNSFTKTRKALEGTSTALSSAFEKRDPYTAGHQQRVSNLACAIANEMGLPQDNIEGIRIAGILHDIGKISVPAEILSKPGKLTDIEFSLIKTHSQVSYDILKEVEFPWPVANIALQHHERFNGSGYPQGLSGEKILLEARILAVADVVEAMASHRPYRAAIGIDKALMEISQNKGKFYDPKVADACLKIFADKKFDFNKSYDKF